MPSPTTLYSVAEIRDIERAAQATLPEFTLMQRAGRAASDLACELAGEQPEGAPVLVLAGPGNNGGDALEAAANLEAAGFEVTVLMFADAARLPADAARALARARDAGVRFGDMTDAALVFAAASWVLAIDGLFGIGLTRAIATPISDAVEILNRLACPVLSLDVPSGLDADTGNLVGGAIAVEATHTITFIAGKSGLHTGAGRDYAGKVAVADLGIDQALFPAARMQLSVPDSFRASLQSRRHDSHKGTYGDVIIAGGAHGMSGAAILAATAAARCGAGRVFAAFLDEPPAYDPLHPELMCRSASNVDFSKTTVVLGPGLGMSSAAHDVVRKVLEADSPAVIDADALNLIAGDAVLQQQLAARRIPALLTPHPLEAARLLQTNTAQIQASRIEAARSMARRFNAVVVLKGSGSVVARPDGHIAINTSGNPALATAGSGDVLAGLCGALLAQHWDAWNAAIGATWMHGHAADRLVAAGTGPIGLAASELIPELRATLNHLTELHAQRRHAR